MNGRPLHGYRWLLENITDTVCRFDLDSPIPVGLPEDEQIELLFRHGYLADCNDNLAHLYGYAAAAEIFGHRIGLFLDPADSRSIDYLRAFIRSGYHLLDVESTEVDRNGNTKYLVKNLVGILDDGRLFGAWETRRDITASKQTLNEMQHSLEQFSIILANIADSIIVHDGSGRVLYVNEATARLLEFPSPDAVIKASRSPEASTNERLLEVRDEAGRLVPIDEVPYRRALRGEDVGPTLLSFRQASRGVVRRVVSQARPVKDAEGRVRMVIAIMHDITDLSKAQDQFRQAQKMEAIGRLAGGVAHDFNNLLTAINGYSDLLLNLMDAEDLRRRYVEEIRKAGDRAANLTNQLLAYSRKQMLSPKLINPNSVVSGLETMLRRLIGEEVRLVTDLDPEAKTIRADPGQVGQTILNLVVNARDAMPKGGEITLRSGNLRVPSKNETPDPALPPGEYVVLSVADTGMGMDEDVKSHLFEPFFTTKTTGHGTGLGLSTAYGIAKQSGGTITATSEPEKGATFQIYFPAAEGGSEETGAGHANGTRKEADAPRGRETVLVAEDEESVRRLVVGILSGLGYTVIEAVDGLDALDVAGRHASPIDLLLTDVVMGRMGGRELMDNLRRLRPGLKTLYMSGYTDDAVVLRGVQAAGENFLQKPFTPGTLARMVRQVLDAPTSRAAA